MTILEPKIGTIPEIAKAILMASPDGDTDLGKTVFFIGAGCSASAGIPLVSEIAQSLATSLAKKMRCPESERPDSTAAYRWLHSRKFVRDCCDGPAPAEGVDDRPIDWSRAYDAFFDESFTEPDEIRRIFSGFVDKIAGKINWAHLCLGELVRQKFVSTVITTNFDQLALAGLVRAGVLPAMCDGIESLSRIKGGVNYPQLIELHGSRYTYNLRNSREAVAQLQSNSPAITAIGSIFQNLNTLVVVGYGGREDGIMDVLIDAATRFPDKRLVWIMYGKDPKQCGDKALRFLATSRNSLLLLDQDADSFFLRLLQALGIGAPEGIREPLMLAETHAKLLAMPDKKAVVEHTTITAEVERFRSEIVAIKESLAEHRDARTKTEMGITKARELKLAGKLEEALSTLQAIPKKNKDKALLSEIAELAHSLDERKPDNKNLTTALVSLRRIAALIDRNIDPIDWAAIQHRIGNALRRLGERKPDNDSLSQAVVAYRSALAIRTHENMPLEWAATQNELGVTLFRLGEREHGTEQLKLAVEAFRAGLSEHTRDRAPLDWAMAQGNLGNALKVIGEREDSAERLEQAVAAYRETTLEYTRERTPLEWAANQNNLGVALVALGQHEKTIERYEQAVVAYRDALLESTRDRAPLDWAATQNNLGNVLSMLGEREGSAERLEQAINAYREALLEHTRDRVPLDWAMSTGNQGVALAQLAERTGDTKLAERAVSQIEAALSVTHDGGHAPNAAYYENQLPKARTILAKLQPEVK